MSDKKQLKQRINDGEIIIGAAVSMDAGVDRLKSVLDQYPYDFFSLDSQHSPFSEHQLVDFCNLADDLDIDVHFRIKHTRHSYLVGNILDLGPTLIEIPQVESVTTVDEAVEHFYFPPVARRSWIGGDAKNLKQLGLDRVDYANWWKYF